MDTEWPAPADGVLCRRCGQVNLPAPSRGRFACGNCGRPLSPPASKARRRLALWAARVRFPLLLAGGLVFLAWLIPSRQHSPGYGDGSGAANPPQSWGGGPGEAGTRPMGPMGWPKGAVMPGGWMPGKGMPMPGSVPPMGPGMRGPGPGFGPAMPGMAGPKAGFPGPGPAMAPMMSGMFRPDGLPIMGPGMGAPGPPQAARWGGASGPSSAQTREAASAILIGLDVEIARLEQSPDTYPRNIALGDRCWLYAQTAADTSPHMPRRPASRKAGSAAAEAAWQIRKNRFIASFPLSRQRLHQARAAYQRALLLAQTPEQAGRAHQRLAVVECTLGGYRDALTHADQARRQAGDDARLQRVRQVCQAALKRAGGAARRNREAR